MRVRCFTHLLWLSLALFLVPASSFGSTGPIAAAYGGASDASFFCAIDAGGRQEVLCWSKNSSSSSSLSPSPSPSSSSSKAPYSDEIPPMAALSGGEGFICGISANTSLVVCWTSLGLLVDLVPPEYRFTAYSRIAAGKAHVCAVRGSYYSDHDYGTVDCWEVLKSANRNLTSRVTAPGFRDQYVTNLVFKNIVSGDGFTCGIIREGGLACWGPNSSGLGIALESESFEELATGIDSLCGISNSSREIKCWGDKDSFANLPTGIRFVSLAAGASHFCGVREDNHGVECWGASNVSAVPKGSGFFAVASSDFTTCGIREDDLVLDCWSVNDTSSPSYDPPLELCSPGLCRASPCGQSEFAFNAGILNEPDLMSLCARKDLYICSPCGSSCPEGFFLSSPCSTTSDRVCTPCSLCQNSSCSDICNLRSYRQKYWSHLRKLVLITGACVCGAVLVIILGCVLRRCLVRSRRDPASSKKQLKSGKSEFESNNGLEMLPLQSVATCPGAAQIFRLSELKDATNGFKEFNELGRGSFGFVYKAVLSDGSQVAVKRASAATIIHSSSREFETELELLCSIRHCNIVNLIGYCSEMGERLLVYEFMPHGTLHDHLHNGLSPLNWTLRIKIAAQAAKGLEYLHQQVNPPIVHRDVKSSNILLDADWVGRIADFRLVSSAERDVDADKAGDVYGFGVVLLEILSGRKAYDRDFTPPGITEWALPLIRSGKAASIVDRYVALPRNFEPLLRLAEIAGLSVRDDPTERPSMADVASWLEQIARDGLAS